VSDHQPQVRLERTGDVIELIWAAPRLNLFTAAVADEFESALEKVPDGAKLAAGPTRASNVSRQLLRAARDQGIAAADAITPALTGPVLMGDDAAIGIKSLLEHGPGGEPSFTGR
jgi:hypothetical protein